MKMNMKELQVGDVIQSYANSNRIYTYEVVAVGIEDTFGDELWECGVYTAPAIQMINNCKWHNRGYVVTQECRDLNANFESVFRNGEKIFG